MSIKTFRSLVQPKALCISNSYSVEEPILKTSINRVKSWKASLWSSIFSGMLHSVAKCEILSYIDQILKQCSFELLLLQKSSSMPFILSYYFYIFNSVVSNTSFERTIQQNKWTWSATSLGSFRTYLSFIFYILVNQTISQFGGPVVYRPKNPPNWAEWAVHANMVFFIK